MPSAYEAPGPRGRRARRARVRQCVDPHGLPCAVQARCNSCLVSRGDAPVGPAGPDAPPSPLPCRLRPLCAQRRASCFFLVSKPRNSCNQNVLRSRTKNTKTGPDPLVLTSRPPSYAERGGHPIVVVQCNSSLLSRGRSCGQYVEASHRRNTWLTLFPTAGERRLRGTRAGQWTPPV